MSFELPGIAEDEKAALEEATAPENFDVFAFVKKTNTPELPVTLYTDADAALKLFDLKNKQSALDGKNKELADTFSLADDSDYSYEIEELETELRDSALTFRLKGLAPKALDAFTKAYEAKHGEEKAADETQYNINFNNTLVAKSIVNFDSPDGQTVVREWTADGVAELVENLYVSESSKLYSTTARANYVGAVFDAAVSADFS